MRGKIIYTPKGKAGEYAKWAANFYVGCSAKCEYCYNRKGFLAKALGGDVPVLKKNFKTPLEAYSQFMREVTRNLGELQKHGLFFNFVSDPCLPETILLNQMAMRFCIVYDIPITILTKQAEWVKPFVAEYASNGTIWNIINAARLFNIGFTLTGHDELEPGASTNQERINAMRLLHNHGFKTWASIEPVIDFASSFLMITETGGICDEYKIGLASGVKFNKAEANGFVDMVRIFVYVTGAKLHLKDSLKKYLDHGTK